MRLAEIQSGRRLILPTPPAALKVGLLIPQHIISIRRASQEVEGRSECREQRDAALSSIPFLSDCTHSFALSLTG